MFGIGLSDAYGRGDFMSVSKNDTKGRQNGGGDAYVRAAQKFDSYTLHVMLNCPERWREYLVTPITNDTRRIAGDTVMANSFYVRMDRQSSLEDVIAAYDQRISCLEDALRTFGQFECDLDRLMGQVDLFASERKRLASLLCRVLRDDGFVPNVNGNGCHNGDETGTREPVNVLEVRYKFDCVEYTTCYGQTHMRLGFDARKRDIMLGYERDARKLISERLAKDRQQRAAYRSRFEKKACMH